MFQLLFLTLSTDRRNVEGFHAERHGCLCISHRTRRGRQRRRMNLGTCFHGVWDILWKEESDAVLVSRFIHDVTRLRFVGSNFLQRQVDSRRTIQSWRSIISAIQDFSTIFFLMMATIMLEVSTLTHEPLRQFLPSRSELGIPTNYSLSNY